MSSRRRALAAAAEHERDVARAIGSRRTARIGSRRREPDVAPIVVAGERLIAEAKLRARIPRVIEAGLIQARGYDRGAVPMVVLRARGDGAAVACLPLEALCRLLGLRQADMPTRHVPTARDPRQIEMFREAGR